MNSLFNLPLHGVFLAPFCRESDQLFPLKITLDFSSLIVDNTWQPVWSMVDAGERYHSEVNLYKAPLSSSNSSNNPDYYLQINCQGSGVFKISKNNITIDWQAQGTGAEHYFQTLAVALNLELNQVLCVHANALAYNDQAIALVAPSRTGKTTLTAALSQNGFALMTDDMIALHEVEQGYNIYPSWPVARMWPDALDNLQLNTKEQHQKVHENFEKRTINLAKTDGLKFCNDAKKLKVIYLLNRLPQGDINQESEHSEHKTQGEINNNSPICEIVPIATAKAIIILLQNSILGSCYRALNIEQARVKALSRLLENIAFKQINYVSGKEHLNAVGKAIIKDLS